MSPRPSVGAVVLSMGDRTQELGLALDTLLKQEDVDLDIVVVGNGWVPAGLPDRVRSLHLEDNVGIPEGRNVGARAARGELLFFYDDDAHLPTTDVLARLAAQFEDARLAVAQPRGADPDGRPAPRRWVPRLRTEGGGRPGEVVVFWEGVCMVRRSAFDAVGGWPGHFWYGHEGIDLAFRLVDGGWTLRYCPDVVVHHPATQAARHQVFYRMNARNRVWVARRNLPAPLVPIYLGVWVAATLARVRQREALKVWFTGFAEGWRTDPGRRRPMRWSTVWRLTRAGRPPVV